MRFSFKWLEPPPWVKNSDWQSWQWQLRNSLKTSHDFSRYYDLSTDEEEMFKKMSSLFQVRSTPYYAGLSFKKNSTDPIRQLVVPNGLELQKGQQQMLDPLGEHKHSPVEGLIHRYPDRVLFLVTDQCGVYCRYCTRKHFTAGHKAFIGLPAYKKALKYIREHKSIREVILSGGDPLSLGDSPLLKVLKDLRDIESIEIIRLATRMPVVCPMRITEGLVKNLKLYKPLYLMTHFNHPRELTEQAKNALELLVDNGIPVFNQMVLLNGINNHPALVQALSRRLLYLRVKPYYMFQCDPSLGTDHLRTSIEDSLEIQAELWGKLSGLAMPNLSLDIPGGGGKVGLVPEFEVSQDKNSRTYRGFDDYEASYINPSPEQIKKPIDIDEYIPEWEEIKKKPSFL